MRFFGVVLFMVGVNEKFEFFEIDLSGVYFEWKVVVIGSGRNIVMVIFEEYYRDDIGKDDVIKFVIFVFVKIFEELIVEGIEVVYIIMDEKCWKKFLREEFEKYINEIF